MQWYGPSRNDGAADLGTGVFPDPCSRHEAAHRLSVHDLLRV